MKISFEIAKSGTPVEKEARSPLARETAMTSAQLDAAARAGTTQPAAMLVGDYASGEPPNPGPLPSPAAAVSSPAVRSSEPIRWPFTYAVNQTLTPRGEDRRLTPFEQLRTIADVFDIARIAIEARKDQLCALKWDFAPRERSNATAASNDEKSNVAKLRSFFKKPDRSHDFDTWMRMATEDVLVVDALSVYKRRTRGGAFYSLELIDGTTIKPLIDGRGFTPQPPNVAYRQIIYGRPIKGGDCTVDQLLYRPRTVRTWTPYGLSPIESVLLTINTALNRQTFNLGYYSEGNVPEGLMSTPEGWSTDQIREFQTYWDSVMVGNPKMRSRLRFVGPKMAESIYQFKDPSFDTQFDEWLLQVVCAAFGVQPQELGFTNDVNRAQGEQQENITYRRGVKPLASFFKRIFDDVIETDLGMPDYEAIFTGGETEDRLAQAKIDEIYSRIGKVSIDELRRRDGEEQIGLGPYVMTTAGPVFVEQLIRERDEDPTTSDPKNPDAPVDDKTGKAAKTPPPAEDDDDTADDADNAQKAADLELSAFRRFVVNRVKAGKPIDVAKFATVVTPKPLLDGIASAIAKTAGSEPITLAHVAATFDAVEKAVGGARVKTDAQRRYRKVLKSFFGDLASALGTHLGDGVES